VTSAVNGVSSAAASRLLAAMRPGEIKLATQDATCQQVVGLAAVAAHAQDQTQNADERRYSGQLKTYSAELEHATQLAASLQSSKS
jgi:hypothetical protein